MPFPRSALGHYDWDWDSSRQISDLCGRDQLEATKAILNLLSFQFWETFEKICPELRHIHVWLYSNAKGFCDKS